MDTEDIIRVTDIAGVDRGGLRAHPFGDLFPMMEGADFDKLVADIKKNELIHPIVLLDGMILDGRNRYKAIRAIGQWDLLRVVEYEGDQDPLDYVISVNLNRRHLDESQRAMIAAKLANMRNTIRRARDRQICLSRTLPHLRVKWIRSVPKYWSNPKRLR